MGTQSILLEGITQASDQWDGVRKDQDSVGGVAGGCHRRLTSPPGRTLSPFTASGVRIGNGSRASVSGGPVIHV